MSPAAIQVPIHGADVSRDMTVLSQSYAAAGRWSGGSTAGCWQVGGWLKQSAQSSVERLLLLRDEQCTSNECSGQLLIGGGYLTWKVSTFGAAAVRLSCCCC